MFSHGEPCPLHRQLTVSGCSCCFWPAAASTRAAENQLCKHTQTHTWLAAGSRVITAMSLSPCHLRYSENTWAPGPGRHMQLTVKWSTGRHMRKFAVQRCQSWDNGRDMQDTRTAAKQKSIETSRHYLCLGAFVFFCKATGPCLYFLLSSFSIWSLLLVGLIRSHIRYYKKEGKLCKPGFPQLSLISSSGC